MPTSSNPASKRPDLLHRLTRACAEREQAGLLRRLHAVEPLGATRVRRDGRELTMFCSNDYLGLTQHPDLIAALRKAASEYGVGSGSAHLICGHSREHAALEEALAEWTGRERALLFSTGVMANAGVLQALLQRGDVCVQDKLNHASLIDAAQLSGAHLKRYPHADVEAAARQLGTQPEAAALLATDGVFSMDGDIAPLPELAALCRAQGATLMVDDAHGLGVHGAHGAGSLAETGLDTTEVPVLMGTLGKALGCAGAFVAGSAALIEGLVQFARSYIYTTAMPPALAAATRAAVRIAREADDRREILRGHIRRFREGAAQLDLPLLPSNTPIQPLLLGSAARANAAAQALEQAGLLVTAIRPPTVPRGHSRLRITLSAAHTPTDIDRLLETLAHLHSRAPLLQSLFFHISWAVMSELFIQTRGHGDTHMVLLHGWAMHGGIFEPLIEVLEDRCTLHVIDLPGHGRSHGSGLPLETATCARAIADVTPPAVWLGWSMGGLIALTAALEHPQSVQALAMLSSSPCFVRKPDWPYGMPPDVFEQFSRDLDTDYRATLERFLALEAMGSAHAREDMRRLRKQVFAHGEPDPRVLKQGLELLDRTDLRAGLSCLRQSSVWISGHRDRLVSPAAMAAAAEQSGGVHHDIAHAGHAAFIGFADTVVQALEPLLTGVPA
jgi:8-amino-7-oxononanoate synthase